MELIYGKTYVIFRIKLIKVWVQKIIKFEIQ